MDVFNLYAKIFMDTSEYEKGLDEASGKSSSFIDKLGTGIKVAAAAGSAAISAFAATSIRTGQQFDSSMSQVAATMGVTVDEIQDLRDFAQEMGATTAFSASQAADALNYMALAGYDAETSMEMLPNVLNLAAAGGMELAAASDMITDSQSALGLSLDETTELVDKMAKASSKTNTSVSQLGDAILTVGGTAKLLSGGTTELTQVLGLLADNGIKASESGTHLRNILLSLQDAADDKGWIGLGEVAAVQLYDAEGNLRNLSDVFFELNNELGNFSLATQTAFKSGIFNKTDLAAVDALLSTQADRWDEVAAAIDDAGGAAQAMADTQLDNLQGDLTIMQSALEGAQIALSDKLTPAFRMFVQAGTSGLTLLTEALKNGDIEAALQPIGDTLSTVWEAISSTIETVMPTIEEAFANLQEVIQPIIDRFTDYSESGQLLDDVTTIISDGITILAGVISGLVQTVADIIDGIDTLVYWLSSGDEAAEQLKLTVIAVTAAFVGYKAALAIGTLITTITNGIKALTAATTLQEIAQKALNLAMELNPIGLVIAAITALVAAFKYLWDTNETFRNFWILVWDDIKENFQLVADYIAYIFTEKIPSMVESVKEKFEIFKLALQMMALDIYTFFTETIPEGISKMLDIVKSLPDKAKQFGKDFVKGLWNGINNMAQWIKEKIQGFGEGVLNNLKDFFGIHSPSTVMRDVIGKNLMLGFGEGIEDNKWDALSSVNDFANDFRGTINNDLIGGLNAETSMLMAAANARPSLTTGTAAGSAKPTENRFYLDGREIARAILPYLEEERQRLGTSLTKGALT